MSIGQMTTFYELIKQTPIKQFDHGCCVGADQQAYMAMYDLKRDVPVHAWPPVDPKWLALEWELFCDVAHPPNDYHARDRDIVNDCDLLIATPLEDWPTTGGTFYTMGYAISQEIPVLHIKRSGMSTYL